MPQEPGDRGPDWELYAAHREVFTRVVLSASGSTGGRLCVLGAGKCNDLDLRRLGEAFRELHLVDLEPRLLASAIAREAPELRKRLIPHAPVDLSVVTAKRVSKWQRRSPSSAELAELSDATRQSLLARLPGPFDVVVSACVLTQLGFALASSFSDQHPLLGPLRLCIARTHLQTLVELAEPSGSALFVSDLASSTHYPLDTLPEGTSLDDVQRDIVAKRAFYHLARPDMVRDLLEEAAPERKLTPLSPWLWSGPQSRSYLVYGFRISPNSAP